MNSINSFFSPLSTSTGVTATRKTPSAFDVNSAEFGPTAAAAIGVAAVATDAASATLSLSNAGLQKFSDFASPVIDTVENAFSAVGNEATSLVHDVEDGMKKAYGAVADTVSSVVSKVEHVASSIEDDVSSVASAVGNAATSLKDGVESIADSAGHYLAVGVSALT
jgi:phage-related protein